jgi:hypothetical protein
MEHITLPPPGAYGYAGSCVSCMEGTDTGLVLDGDAEWIIGVMGVIGISIDQALATLRWTDDSVPAGRVQVPVRVCAGCAGPRLKVGLITRGGALPGVSQPVDA